MPNLVEYHMSRLKDRNPQVRIRSAQELALLGDTSALEALEELFRTETNSQVKKAAQEAGRILYEKRQAEQGAEDGS